MSSLYPSCHFLLFKVYFWPESGCHWITCVGEDWFFFNCHQNFRIPFKEIKSGRLGF